MLNDGSWAQNLDRDAVVERLAKVQIPDCKGRMMEGTPFVPLYRRPNGAWRFWCRNLGRDGRCLEYANRPYLCAHYKPASSPICSEYQGVPCFLGPEEWNPPPNPDEEAGRDTMPRPA